MSSPVALSLVPPEALPPGEKVKQYFQAHAVIGETSRYRQLDRFQAHWSMSQYGYLPYDWWGYSADQTETVSAAVQVPAGFTQGQPGVNLLARQKRPTAPYHLTRTIVDRFTGMLFSDVRKPDVEVEGDPDTDDFLHACMEQMRFWARWREARGLGGGCGSVLVTVHIKAGRLVMAVTNAKHVQVLWKDRRALEPLGVLIMYRYPKEEFGKDPQTGEMRPRIVDYLYRRIITDADDTVYKEVKVEPNAVLTWEVESSAAHNLGQFPGVWVQNMPNSESEDGDPDCVGAWQTFDTIDRLLSQMNKALLLNLDPTLVLHIDPKELLQLTAAGGIKTGSDNALRVGTGSATYLEMSGAGVDAAHKLIDRLKQNALDVTRCVLVDPQTIAGAAQSAKAIEYIYAPMLEKADDLRSQWGDLGVIPILKIVEALARKYHGVATQLPDGSPGILKLDLPPKADGSDRKLGPGGWIRLKWGPYFHPTETDKQTQVTTLVAAKNGQLIDGDTAVRQAAPIFGVQDSKAMLDKIAKDAEDEASKMFGNTYGEMSGTPETTPPAGEGGKP